MRYFSTLSVAVCCFSGVFFFACSAGDSTPPPSTTCTQFNYATYMPASTTRILANDILPIFMVNCAISAICHLNGSHQPNLGDGSVSASNAATVSAAIVGMNSTEVSSMKYVVKGEPQNSYLMRKVEDKNPGCDLTCVPPTLSPMGCVTQMPYLSSPLSAPDQTMIRDWIKAGAN